MRFGNKWLLIEHKILLYARKYTGVATKLKKVTHIDVCLKANP
jgi:hypothetical protein